MSIERRTFPRYDVMAQIRVKRGRVNYIMDVKNVSLSGLFVTSDSVKQMPWFRVGQELEMDVFTTEDLVNVRINGHIVRVTDSDDEGQAGFGVEFTSLPDKDKEKLSLFVEDMAVESIHPPPLPRDETESSA
ncbi:MAG: PilZ domain-containing protein [Deltaproteobacteria bacterium]|nr:PilZ domain-containing protein [Deltaproteobacteria bacterium]